MEGRPDYCCELEEGADGTGQRRPVLLGTWKACLLSSLIIMIAYPLLGSTKMGRGPTHVTVAVNNHLFALWFKV